MSYCTKTDIIKVIPVARLNGLAQDNAAQLQADIDAVIAQMISDADNEIDSYLARQYDLPLDETPEIVKKISVELSICNLLAKKGQYTTEYEKKREWIDGMLSKISTGKIVLEFSDESEENIPTQIYFSSDDPLEW